VPALRQPLAAAVLDAGDDVARLAAAARARGRRPQRARAGRQRRAAGVAEKTTEPAAREAAEALISEGG
jgi:hypothetical protein